MKLDHAEVSKFVRPLFGMELTHIWRGYGSAIFLNFGRLHHCVWNNGRLSRNPRGDMSVAITWSWRLEGSRQIWCGSWSDDDKWQRFFDKLIGATVKDVTFFGRLPEIDIEFSCGVHLLSFMTAEGDPEWAIHDDREVLGHSISVRAGRYVTQLNTIGSRRVSVENICMLPVTSKS